MRTVGDAGPYALLAGLFLLTGILGQLISNTATALIIIPIAVAAATELGVSPRPVLMSVAVAAAASFLTPVATPVNLMVMGPARLPLRRLLEARPAADDLVLRRGDIPRAADLAVLRAGVWVGSSSWMRQRDRPSYPPGGCRRRSGSASWWRRRMTRFQPVAEGRVSEVYPALAAVPADLFGMCVVGASGSIYAAGDAERAFTDHERFQALRLRAGLRAAGCGGGAGTARGQCHRHGVQLGDGDRMQPGRAHQPDGELRCHRHDQPGPGGGCEAKWRFIADGLSQFAGRRLALNEEVLASAPATNTRNRGIARLLESYGRIYMDPIEATDLYTRQCSLDVTARDLAVMGATLADGGVNPLTRERVVAATVCKAAGRDGDGRPLRDLGRLALRHRPAGQERHRRWDRHRRARQGRPRHLLAAARRGRQQCPRASSWLGSCRTSSGSACSPRNRRFDRSQSTLVKHGSEVLRLNASRREREMARPRLLVLSLGGTITMVPSQTAASRPSSVRPS